MIYIATTNYSKYKSLKRALHLINNDIKTKSIFRKRLDPPLEIGGNESEDVLTKVKYYSEKIKGNILCEDDKININIKKRNGKIITETISLNAKEKIAYLKQYLSRHEAADGTMIKAIAGFNKKNNSYILERVAIPIKFISPDEKIYRNTFNALNYFMIPKGFSMTFSKMKDIDKEKFSKKYLRKPLRKIIKMLEQDYG